MADESKLSVLDLSSLSEPASKLIEAVRAGIGKVYEPTHIRRLARAWADAAAIEDEAQAQLAERAANRIVADELRKQRNRESVVLSAIEFLPDEVSEDPVDEDWVSEFFGFCENISEPTMQALWARLLAGEVERPSSFSIQTLAILRVMTRRDAETLEEFCRYVSRIGDPPDAGNTGLVVPEGYTTKRLSELGIGTTVEMTNHLATLGLISGSHFFWAVELGEEGLWRYHDRTFSIRPPGHPEGERANEMFVSHFQSLTRAGMELYSLINPEPLPGYAEAIAWQLHSQNATVREV